MKYKLTFALVAALTSTAFAEFKAPLPEFKNEKQLAEWRAEKASEATSQGYAAEETAFFTGKPYLASSGGYAFKYRSYNPGLARWTSEDPSGFPDGANANVYAPTPTTDLDLEGLLKLSEAANKNKVITVSGNSNGGIIADLWQTTTNDGISVIDLWKNVRTFGNFTLPSGCNVAFNCHGYTFGNSEYWIEGQVNKILEGDGFKLITGANKTGAKVAWWEGDDHTAVVNTVSFFEVTKVTGKIGMGAVTPSTPAGQGYSGSIKYYE